MITLALGMVVWGLAFRWVSLTKGDNGISGVPRPSCGCRGASRAPLPFFYFALVARRRWRGCCSGCSCVSPFGLGLRGIRESESRMRALGYNVWLHKYLAFVLAGAFAGFAGVLWAYYNGFVSPDRRAARDLGGDAADGGPRRPGHADRPRAGRRASSCSSRTS